MPGGGPRPNSGGSRAGAGRKRGVPNRLSRESVEYARATGETPLAYLLRVMRDESEDSQRRIEAAKAAAPYVHPRLCAVAVSGAVSLSHEDALAELE